MAEQITTAAELDALPDGSVIRFRLNREHAAIKRGGEWYLTSIFSADSCGYHAQELLDDGATGIAVLTSTDEPERAKPSREDVAETIHAGICGCGVLGSHAYDGTADAVLDLLPGRAVEEVKAEALEEAASVYDVAQISGVFFGAAEYPKAWLRARAASLRGESHG